MITDLAAVEKYPGELGGAKIKSTKNARPPLRNSISGRPNKTTQESSTRSKGPSRWMGQVRLQQFKTLAERLDAKQASKRVMALKAMKAEMTRRFVLLFRLFRHKKYGEELPCAKQIDDDVEDLFEEDKEMIRRIKELQRKDPLAELRKLERVRTAISGLESIKEDEVDDGEGFVDTKNEARVHASEVVIAAVLGREIRDFCTKMIKVRSWLHMVLMRRRYHKIKAAVPKIAGLFRRALARKKANKLRLNKMDQQRVKTLKDFINKCKNKAMMNEAAEKI